MYLEKYTMHIVAMVLLAVVALQSYNIHTYKTQSINQSNAINTVITERDTLARMINNPDTRCFEIKN